MNKPVSSDLHSITSGCKYGIQPRDSTTPEAVARVPSETGDEGAIQPDSTAPGNPAGHPVNPPGPKPTPHSDDKASDESGHNKDAGESTPADKRKSGRSTGAEPFEKWERDEMEKLLGQLNGHLGSRRLYFHYRVRC
jgi:phospholipase D1/2